MAVTTTRTLPAQFIEDLGKDYGTQLAGLTSIPLDTGRFAPKVAAQDPMQAQAYQLGQAGVGAYEPYITGAGAAGMAPGAAPMGAAAATTLGGVPSYLTQAGAYSGPTGYQDFMSPYQQDVIDTTMADFDAQSAKGLAGIGQKAALSGQFLGGGREGVQRAEYQALSDRNRASMLAQLRQQGFGQAQGAAGQAYGQQIGLGQATGALAQQQLGIGGYQTGLAGQVPALQAQDISQLGQLGGIQQAQAQAELGATQEANRMQAMEPYDRMGIYGQGVTGLISGYPGQYQSMSQPNPTALQTALGTASVLGGIYGNIGGGSTQGYQVGSPAYQASQMMMKQPAGYYSQGGI
jgi:hypothetical protein